MAGMHFNRSAETGAAYTRREVEARLERPRERARGKREREGGERARNRQ